MSRGTLLASSRIASAMLAYGWAGSACMSSNRTSVDPPSVITITATDYGYEAPDTVPAGFTVFRLVNRGDHGHGATIVRLEGGRTLLEYIAAYREANRTRSARPTWATFLGGPGALAPGDTNATTNYVDPGSYAWVCFVPGPDGIVHLLAHDQAHAFVARQRNESAPTPSAPEPTVSLQLLDHSFQLSEPLTAGKHLIRVENVGLDPHHALLFKLAAGRTFEDFRAWTNDQQGAPPATLVGMMAELSTGKDAFLEVDLSPGDYVLVCFVASRDEVPHAAKGMMQHIRVD